jgi:hypothetical protein
MKRFTFSLAFLVIAFSVFRSYHVRAMTEATQFTPVFRRSILAAGREGSAHQPSCDTLTVQPVLLKPMLLVAFSRYALDVSACRIV